MHKALKWRRNGRDGVSNHQPHDCLLHRLFRRRSIKISNFRVIGFCVGNAPVIGEFPAQMTSDAEKVSIWWRHHGLYFCMFYCCLVPAECIHIFRIVLLKLPHSYDCHIVTGIPWTIRVNKDTEHWWYDHSREKQYACVIGHVYVSVK